MTSIYIIPAVLAFFTTAYILFLSHKKIGQSKIFYTMVLVFLAHHICEILGFIEFVKNGPHVIYQLKVYYVVTVWSLIYIFLYSLETSNINIPYINPVSIIIGGLLTSLISYGDTIIAGANSLGYVMTAQQGPHYILFQITVFIYLLSTISCLLYGYRKSKSHITQIQCLYMMFSFSPLFLTITLIITLMALGFHINAIALIPISTTLFLIIVFKSESKHKLTDIRRFMPFSSERRTSQEIMEIYSNYTQDEISYRDCMIKIERLLVMNKYNKSGNNASATAKLMGMPRSSLYSIFNRLKIDVKDQ